MRRHIQTIPFSNAIMRDARTRAPHIQQRVRNKPQRAVQIFLAGMLDSSELEIIFTIEKSMGAFGAASCDFYLSVRPPGRVRTCRSGRTSLRVDRARHGANR